MTYMAESNKNFSSTYHKYETASIIKINCLLFDILIEKNCDNNLFIHILQLW